MKFHFHPSRRQKAQDIYQKLVKKYGQSPAHEADAIIVLGGDGTMLRALHMHAHRKTPLYGMNLGTLGFLMNEQRVDKLPERVKAAKSIEIRPLKMRALDRDGLTHNKLAYNEVSILRETHRAAKIKIFVNGELRLPELVCDGVMLSTPLGSTAYNASVGGPIVPLEANLLPLTPISPFRPRRWPGALLLNDANVRFEVIKPEERPVSLSADSSEIRDVLHIEIEQSKEYSSRLLFDPEAHLEERIFQEQFAP